MGTNGFVNRRSPVQSWAPAPKRPQGTGGKKNQKPTPGKARAAFLDVIEMFGARYDQALAEFRAGETSLWFSL